MRISLALAVVPLLAACATAPVPPRAAPLGELHFINASDALCLRQLRDRSKHLPADSRWTGDAEFNAVTAYFEPPTAEEGFHVIRHERE